MQRIRLVGEASTRRLRCSCTASSCFCRHSQPRVIARCACLYSAVRMPEYSSNTPFHSFASDLPRVCRAHLLLHWFRLHRDIMHRSHVSALVCKAHLLLHWFRLDRFIRIKNNNLLQTNPPFCLSWHRRLACCLKFLMGAPKTSATPAHHLHVRSTSIPYRM